MFNCWINKVLCVYYHLLLYLTLGCLQSDCCSKQLEGPAHTYCLSVCECNACRLSRLYSDIVHYILRDGTSQDLFGILIVSVCVNVDVCVFCSGLGLWDLWWGLRICVMHSLQVLLVWVHRGPKWSPGKFAPGVSLLSHRNLLGEEMW